MKERKKVELDDADLTILKGIGPTTAEKLKEAGYETCSQIAVLRPERLAEILNWSTRKARETVNDAQAKVLDLAIQEKTGEDVLNYRKEVVQKISTGSRALDSILKGGVSTSAVTMLFGKEGTGKTQLAHQLVINMKKQYNRKAAWIETEAQTFDPERLLQMAENQGVEFDLKKDIIVFTGDQITDSQKQSLAYVLVEKRIQKGMDIGILVVDSFNARFRFEYSGREMLRPRSSEMGQHMGYLHKLAAKYNIAVVLTSQVMGIPDTGGQQGAMMKYGIPYVPVGGLVMRHMATWLIALDQVSAKDMTWKAITSDCPVPRQSAMFKIDEYGVRDTSRR